VHALSFIVLAAEEAAEPSKTPFYVLGGLLAAWAVIVSTVGITQPDFPRSRGLTRAVIAVSLLLVVGAMSAAVATS
jgi:hypothetical protein